MADMNCCTEGEVRFVREVEGEESGGGGHTAIAVGGFAGSSCAYYQLYSSVSYHTSVATVMEASIPARKA
jgi:hypothetical protein